MVFYKKKCWVIFCVKLLNLLVGGNKLYICWWFNKMIIMFICCEKYYIVGLILRRLLWSMIGFYLMLMRFCFILMFLKVCSWCLCVKVWNLLNKIFINIKKWINCCGWIIKMVILLLCSLNICVLWVGLKSLILLLMSLIVYFYKLWWIFVFCYWVWWSWCRCYKVKCVWVLLLMVLLSYKMFGWLKLVWLIFLIRLWFLKKLGLLNLMLVFLFMY